MANLKGYPAAEEKNNGAADSMAFVRNCPDGCFETCAWLPGGWSLAALIASLVIGC